MSVLSQDHVWCLETDNFGLLCVSEATESSATAVHMCTEGSRLEQPSSTRHSDRYLIRDFPQPHYPPSTESHTRHQIPTQLPFMIIFSYRSPCLLLGAGPVELTQPNDN
jgi:hypothetical protein